MCPWVQKKEFPPQIPLPRQSSVSMFQPLECPRPRLEVSPRSDLPTLVGPPSASGTGVLSPGVLGQGSRGRLGGVVGLAWGAMPPGLSASRTGPARQRMAAARPCIICSGYRLRSLELSFSPLGCNPWLQRKSCQWTSQPPGPGGTHRT